MYNSVQYCICNKFITNHIIPLADRQLTGNNGRLSSVPVFYDLYKVILLLSLQCLHTKVINNKQVYLG